VRNRADLDIRLVDGFEPVESSVPFGKDGRSLCNGPAVEPRVGDPGIAVIQEFGPVR